MTATDPVLYIEAHPGSGKTRVAAERFGYLVHAPAVPGARARAVVASTFTKAATNELRHRTRQLWGSGALRAPHRIITIDTLFRDLLEWLVREGHVDWPGQPRNLVIVDSWRLVCDLSWQRIEMSAVLRDGAVRIIRTATAQAAPRVDEASFSAAIEGGRCTHDEVRSLLTTALGDIQLAARLAERLRATIRHLIVDEVFDANEQDVRLIEACLAAEVEVTLIGDPWQALYEFRGADREAVLAMVRERRINPLPLSRSFRWRTDGQRQLADTLRSSLPVTLPEAGARHVDVALARWWKHLWQADAPILGLAFKSAERSLAYAATTLLLSQVTGSVLGLPSVFLRDALSTLRLADSLAHQELEPWLERIHLRLAVDPKYRGRDAFSDLLDVLHPQSGLTRKGLNAKQYECLNWLKERLSEASSMTLGLTVHQAKGREWDTVGVVLEPDDLEALAAGLNPDNPEHRRLYVACTRARRSTLAFPL